MATRAQLIAEARTWIGTPFHHQGRLKAVGVDCIGAMVAPAIACGLPLEDVTNYSRQPNPENTLAHLRRNLDGIAVADARIGDVLFFWFGIESEPHHFGLITDIGLLHAYDAVKKSGKPGLCVETGLHKYWPRRIHSAWRFRGLED